MASYLGSFRAMSDENGSMADAGEGQAATIAKVVKDDEGSPGAHKRKAPSPATAEKAASNSPKRTKVDNATERRGSAGSPPASRAQTTVRRPGASKDEEKNRGKRLFGGLLNTLSQTTTSSQQRKRQEIERRQQAKVHNQRAEDDKHIREKLARVQAVREREQLKFDEQVMRTRHSQMLATARFLETRTEPKIYFLPWDPTAEEEDIVRHQIQAAEATVDREVREFKQHRDQKMKELGIPIKPPTPKPNPLSTSEPIPKLDETVGKPVDDDEPQAQAQAQAQAESTNLASTHTTKAGQDKDPDEVMVEDEDTVIY